ncbi:MAG TPA: 7-cyano-7-deazaguanine synthase QueC [bacterium]|nr:7-cyano-7-deazaguanine synthase QueC [bacterium]
MKNAVVLLSGGLDSATTLYYALRAGYRAHCLVFDYGQRHRKEVLAARRIARAAGAACEVVRIALPWKGSALLETRAELPGNRRDPAKKIPATYVPARNTILMSFALSCAEAIGASAVFIGANAIDYSGYPDCRPDYFRALSGVFARGTKAGVEGRRISIKTPLLRMSKEEIVALGMRLGVPFELTWSCYAGEKRPCGVCDSCRIRAKGFRRAGIFDPAV